MARTIFKLLCASSLSAVMMASMWGQQATPSGSAVSYPSGNPGLYVQDGANWDALAPAAPARIKAKHGFASSLTYGAVAAPVVAVYPGTHAQVQVHATRPLICVYHLITTDSPVLVHLKEKKDTRELDSGHIRASVVGSSHQAKADASIVVPTTTTHSEDGTILLRPQTDLAPGEYAVMFGLQNLAIFDFGVTAAP